MFIDREGIFLDSLSEELDRLYSPLDDSFREEIENAMQLLGYNGNLEVVRGALYFRWLMHSQMN